LFNVRRWDTPSLTIAALLEWLLSAPYWRLADKSNGSFLPSSARGFPKNLVLRREKILRRDARLRLIRPNRRPRALARLSDDRECGVFGGGSGDQASATFGMFVRVPAGC